MRHYIIKFIPKDDSQQKVIHKIKMPEISEKGFYRQSVSFNAFCSGRRADTTEEDIKYYRHTCQWAPTGLYYTNEFIESEWLRQNASRLESLSKFLDDVDAHDETKFPTIIHENIFSFYDYIGFDRKKRKYR